MMVFLLMLHTEQCLKKTKLWKKKNTDQLQCIKSKCCTVLLRLCLCLSAEGPHFVSIKVLETGAEWVHFKICSCGKI